MKKKIYIADTTSTGLVADVLQKFYGEKVEIYTDPQYHIKRADRQKELDQLNIPFENTAKDPYSADIFFLSPKLIVEKKIDFLQLIEEFGKASSVVVMIYTTGNHMDQVLRENPGKINFQIPKSNFMVASIRQLKDEDQKKLREILGIE
jgi:hypothetical protein